MDSWQSKRPGTTYLQTAKTKGISTNLIQVGVDELDAREVHRPVLESQAGRDVIVILVV